MGSFVERKRKREREKEREKEREREKGRERYRNNNKKIQSIHTSSWSETSVTKCHYTLVCNVKQRDISGKSSEFKRFTNENQKLNISYRLTYFYNFKNALQFTN